MGCNSIGRLIASAWPVDACAAFSDSFSLTGGSGCDEAVSAQSFKLRTEVDPSCPYLRLASQPMMHAGNSTPPSLSFFGLFTHLRSFALLQCYHYERRVTYTTVRDSDGKERTETTFTTVRVDTYRETKPFRFDLWRDVSDPMPLIRGYPLTKLHCGKTLVFADALSRARFDAAHAELVERNRFRDDHYETGWKLQVDGFSSHVLASADGTVTPCGVSLPIYLMLSLLGLSYPYRLWLERKCVRAHYRFTKEVRCLV